VGELWDQLLRNRPIPNYFENTSPRKIFMNKLCRELNLLQDIEGVIRIPFLIKGQLIIPPEIDRARVEAAFSSLGRDTNYVKLENAQIIREKVIDRETLQYTGNYLYQVMPSINSKSLIEADIDKLVRGAYALSVDDTLDYLSSFAHILSNNMELVGRVLELTRRITEYPDAFLDSWAAAIYSTLADRETARQMIDTELSLWGQPGSAFLNGWVEVPARIQPETLPLQEAGLIQGIVTHNPASSASAIRAMPTRQLHITAGNTPEAAVISALRAVLTRAAAVIKLPFGGIITGSLLALAAASIPDHPLTRNLSLVYWQGGDEAVENDLFKPLAFDRIIVWGAPETVKSVQSRALYTRVVCFNPRYGVSLIGREAFGDNLKDVVLNASTDSLIYNQKACTSSLVHYIEGTGEQVNRYTELLRETLGLWDEARPQFVSPFTRGQIKRLRRGKYSSAGWYLNEKEGEFRSGVMVAPGEFDILDHPMCRLIVVRQMERLTDALNYLHPGVSAAGIYPEERRLELRDYAAARGVSGIFPLGQCERLFAGMPHDGMSILSQLVDWKNG
jgi:hypothetical protein